MPFELNVNAKQLIETLKGDEEALEVEMKRVLRNIFTAFDAKFRRNQFIPYQGGFAGRRMQNRTGALRNSFLLGRLLGADLSTIRGSASIGSRLAPYARIHEFGGTIRPKRAQHLTVPLRSALNSSGVLPRREQLVNRGGRWQTRGGDPTFIRRSKRGNKIVFASKGGDIRPLYVLKRSVRIKPRLQYFDTWKRMERREFPAIIRRRTAAVLARRSGK